MNADTTIIHWGNRWKLESTVWRDGVAFFESIEIDEHVAHDNIIELTTLAGVPDYEQQVGRESWHWEVVT